jgi:hypothetical protein
MSKTKNETKATESKAAETKKEETKPADGAAKAASLAALKAQLAGQLVGHHFGAPTNPEAYNKPTNIVTAENGVFRVVKTPIAIFKTQLAETTKVGKTGTATHKIPGTAPMTEGVELSVPKIPFKYWLQVFNFYKDVDTKDKTEASVLFFWNTNDEDLPDEYTDGSKVKGLTIDGKLIIYCPRQKNSAGLSEFGHDGMVEYLRKHTTPLLETHSHHTMNAYFSGTDDANENMNQFYAVYGKIQSAEPAFAFRFCSGEHKIECDPTVLFDFPQIKKTTRVVQEFVGVEGVEPNVEEKVVTENYKGPWPVVAYPEDWMEQHSKSTVTVRDYGYNYGKSGGGAGSKSPSTGGHWDNYYDDYDYYDQYGYGASPGSYGHASGGRGSEDKNHSGSNASKNNALKKTSETDATETIEVGETKVEIYATEIANTFSETEVKELVTELCEYGYDHVLLDIIKEGTGYDNGYDGYHSQR